MILHEYKWTTADWDDTLPATLEKLEDEGWEIFTVTSMGGSEYCWIVYRREVTRRNAR